MPGSVKTGMREAVGLQSGFSLPELMVSVAMLMIISGAVMSALLQMTKHQSTIWNRTEMHSGVRSATELLQQEVGQAGRISLPATVTLNGAVAVANFAQTVAVSSAAGMFVNEWLVIDTGTDKEETVQLTAVDAGANEITAIFVQTHAANVPVRVVGGFASGIVPPTLANGSTANTLKLYGDVNDDGNMVYVEYSYAGGNLYRNVMAWNAASKPAVTASQILLSNIVPNPNGTDVFMYQPKTVGADTYIVDVAITLTAQTQSKDPITNQYQTETKALLNVAPRNVFDAWQMASLGFTNRIQPMPASVQALLP